MSYRTELAEARATLRAAQDTFEIVQAQAEARIIERYGSEKDLGTNADARTRTMTIELRNDSEYVDALTACNP